MIFIVFFSCLSSSFVYSFFTHSHHSIVFSQTFVDIDGFVYDDNTKQKIISAPDNIVTCVVNRGVITIGGGDSPLSGAFYSCRNTLKEVTFEDSNLIQTIGNFAFASQEALEKIDMSNCLNLNDLGKSTFKECRLLKSVKLPPNNQYLKQGTFFTCISLKTLNIPEKVTHILGYESPLFLGFLDCSGIETVTFEGTSHLKTIGTHGFSYSTLRRIRIPRSVTEIGDAFVYCKQLEAIEVEEGNTVFSSMDNGVLFEMINNNPLYKLHTFPMKLQTTYSIPEGTVITSASFWGNSLITNVEIPTTLKDLNDNCFNSCNNLENINLKQPSQLSRIKGGVFLNCEKLKKFVIPSTVTLIENGAFSNCKNIEIEFSSGAETNSPYGIDRGLLYSKTELKTISFFQKNMENDVYTIPSYIKIIGSYSFLGGTPKEIIVPESVKRIDTQPFARMPNLVRVQILSTELSLENGEQAFIDNELLEEVTFVHRDSISLKFLPNMMFQSTPNLTTFYVPKNVGKIGSDAFYNSGVKEIIFSTSQTGGASILQTIEQGAFRNTYNLKEFIFPVSVVTLSTNLFESSSVQIIKFDEENAKITELPSFAFAKSISLESIILPKSLTNIKENCFQFCKSLKSILIPENVKIIGEASFQDCESIETISFKGKQLSVIGGGAFVGCKKLSMIDIVQDHPYFIYNKTEHVLYTRDMTTIVVYLPMNQKSVYQVPDGIKVIYAHAFEYAENLEEIDMSLASTSITTIEYRSFKGCIKLTKLKLPSSIQIVAYEAFRDTNILKCNSVEYTYSEGLYNQLRSSSIPEVALNPCPPTKEFTQSGNGSNLLRHLRKSMLLFSFSLFMSN